MALFDFLKRTKKGGVPASFMINSGIMSSIVTKTDALDFYKSWVYACVDKRATGLAQLDYKLYQKKGNKIVEIFEHPLLDLLLRVNPQMTKFNFLKLTSIYKDLLGASPWILEKTKPNSKYPDQIYIARPEFFSVQRGADGSISGYKYEIGAFKKTFSPSEVIFIRNYNPKDPDKGLGVIEAIRQTAENDDYINQTNNNLLKNGARPGGYFETDETYDEDERKRILKELRSKYSGYDNAFKIQVLESGLKFKSDLIAPRDLEFIEGKKLNRDEIAAIFGVPKSLLTSDSVNRANAEAGLYQFNSMTLQPMAMEIIEQINEFLVPQFGSNLWLGFEPFAKEDSQAILENKKAGWNKWNTTNEIREMEGKPPIPGGNYIYLPVNTVPAIGTKSVEKIKIGGEEKVDVNYVDLKTQKYVLKRILNRNIRTKAIAEKISDDVIKKLENNKIILKLVSEKKLTDEQKEIFYKDRMATEPILEKLWKEKSQVFFRDQEKRFIAQLEKANIKKGFSTELGIDKTNEEKLTIDFVSPLVYETVMTGAEQAGRLIDQPSIADMAFLENWVKNSSKKLGEQITSTTLKQFDKSLAEGIQAGEGLGELKKRVKKIFEYADDARAEMIARTETARGIIEAHRQTYEYYGFTNVEWLLSPGACDVCIGLAGQQWTTKTIAGQIPVHPDCKCDFTPTTIS